VDKPVTICLPASKSIVNRLLIIEALSGKKILTPDEISCDDAKVLSQVLFEKTNIKNIKNSGTAMRFLTAFLSVKSGEWIIEGSKRMEKRPILELIEVLRSIGADIEFLKNKESLPIKITGKKLTGGKVEIDASQSSQFVSALMLIAPTLKNGLEIVMQNPTSFPYILLTKKVMEDCGIDVQLIDNHIFIKKQKYNLKKQAIESDWSSAAFWYAFLAVSNLNKLKLCRLFENSYQPDNKVVEMFENLGIETNYSKNHIIIQKTNSFIQKMNNFMCKKFEYDFKNTPDLVPVMVALCCLLGVKFNFSGIKNLRIKESDRIQALVTEMEKCGYILQQSENSILWNGKKNEVKTPVAINSHNDHRIAMAFTLVNHKMDLKILDKKCVNKSYPNFWKDLTQITH